MKKRLTALSALTLALLIIITSCSSKSLNEIATKDSVQNGYAEIYEDADIAYAGNHRHHCTMRNEACESTYMFMYEMPVQGGNLILPMDEDIRILAMTAVR